MKRNILMVFAFLAFTAASGQFNESAPWMANLDEIRAQKTNKSNQPYTIYEISQAFENYWKDKDFSVKGSGYKPFKRWENYWMQLVDSEGRLPTSKELWNSWIVKERTRKVPNTTANWISLGPSSTGTSAIGQPGIGRINAIAVDPNDDNVWYTGAPAGGIWKTTDAGATWTPLFDEFPQIGVSGIAIDANDSNIIYISTGDDDASDTYSAGVFKSLDGGATWNETGLNPSNSTNSDVMNEIFIDPTNSNIVWVGTNSGLKKSLDGGVTWDVKREGNITDFRLKPGNPNTVYAVSSNTYYKSTDGGDNFRAISDILPTNGGRMVIGVSEAAPEVVYILVADTQGRGSAYLGLFKSTDSGETFVESPNTTDLFERDQAWYDLAIAVSNTNADEVYTGAINVWKSTNGGDSFTRLNNNDSDVTPAYTHVDIHTLKFYGDKLYCGSDGGIYVTDDGGLTFDDRTAGLEITQFYRLSIAKGDDSRIAAGSQDNSGFVLNEGDWNIYTGGDGMEYEIDPNNSNLIYGFPQFGQVLYITTDAGQSLGGVGAPTNSDGQRISGNWITPLAVNSESEVYSGFDALYKLVGNSWEKVSQNIGSSSIEDIEIDVKNPDIIYIAESNTVYKSSNRGITFVAVGNFDSAISDMSINHSDSNIVYVTTSNRVGTSQDGQPAERGVFKMTVDGNIGTIEDITLDLPTDQAFLSIVHQDRHTQNPIYVGTNLGVYRLDDSLTEWETYFENLPNTPFSDLEISLDEETITASTYGRGIWQSPIPIQVPDNDIRLVSLTPEVNVVLCGEITPEITFENKGTNPANEVTIEYTLDGATPESFVWTGTLNTDETETLTLPSFTKTSIGETVLTVNVSITNDAFDDNNSLSHSFFVNAFGLGGAVNTFENTDDALVNYNEGSEGQVWELGTPSGTLLNTTSSGTQVYGTNLDGNHSDNVKGILVSNCYELSAILAPVLKFDMAYALEENFDIVYVQYSINDGETWNLLGNVNSQPNWYNSDRTNESSGEDDDCQNCPGGQWNGQSTDLVTYAYDFEANAANGETDLTNEDNVLFRIVFHADPNTNDEGVIIDDFVVEGFQDDDDDDNDGILDVDDNCPLVGNANQLDTDGDGIGDVCDMDDDGDGILDSVDNCPLTVNLDQADADNDGIGDICDTDLDNDGVLNADDLCDNTPDNAVVDVTGCTVFSLPANNFSILTAGETCISSNNGSVSISALENLNYTAVITGPTTETVTFSETGRFENLAAGNYEVCVTVSGQADYRQCWNVEITEPETLSVSSKVSSLKAEITLALSGSSSYKITLNDIVYMTSESEISLPLSQNENTLRVETDRDCQGIYEEKIILSSELLIYPNPVAGGLLYVNLSQESIDDKVELSIFNLVGERVLRKAFNTADGRLVLNVSALSKGVYILNIKSKSTLVNYKVIIK